MLGGGFGFVHRPWDAGGLGLANGAAQPLQLAAGQEPLHTIVRIDASSLPALTNSRRRERAGTPSPCSAPQAYFPCCASGPDEPDGVRCPVNSDRSLARLVPQSRWQCEAAHEMEG